MRGTGSKTKQPINEAMLKIEHLSKAFGGLQAVSNLSFSVREGEILGLIGPNGAGKTTVFNLITGMYKPDRGRIVFRGRDITGWPPYRVVEAGIARTFQIPRPFHHKTVAQNVEIALIPNAIFTPAGRRRERIARVAACCARAGLCESIGHTPQPHDGRCPCWNTYPQALPQAGLRKLEIAKALATDPKLLLLDEPFAGLTHHEVEELSDLIRELREEGRTIVIVDHNMRGLMKLVERVVVIHFGQKLAEGTPEEVAHNPAVQEAYLAGTLNENENENEGADKDKDEEEAGQ